MDGVLGRRHLNSHRRNARDYPCAASSKGRERKDPKPWKEHYQKNPDLVLRAKWWAESVQFEILTRHTTRPSVGEQQAGAYSRWPSARRGDVVSCPPNGARKPPWHTFANQVLTVRSKDQGQGRARCHRRRAKAEPFFPSGLNKCPRLGICWSWRGQEICVEWS